jgi:hypothetical protein
VFLHPDIYPVNFSMLTGRVSEEEFMEKHSKEYARLQAEDTSLEEDETED